MNRIWVGTDDGLIHVTVNGGATWKDVTPPDLVPWAKVSMMDASHFDPLGAYAAINTIRLDDLRPHIYRTHDGGRTWAAITSGLPDGATINTVKEDPKRKGLLFAGSETQVYVSFDDGNQWQSLRQNMPATSIRDLVIKDDDLVVGTHGRGFWILDDITPLRQLQPDGPATPVVLFKPQRALRFEWNRNPDTPLAAGRAGWPESSRRGHHRLLPQEGRTRRDLARRYWTRRPMWYGDTRATISRSNCAMTVRCRPTGCARRRFSRGVRASIASSGTCTIRLRQVCREAIRSRRRRTTRASEPRGPWVVPGAYTVRLTVGGKAYTQPLTVTMDPRVKSGALALQQQFALSKRLYDAIVSIQEILPRLNDARDRARAAGNAEVADKLSALVGSGGGRGRGRGAGGGPASLAGLSAQLSGLYALVAGGEWPRTGTDLQGSRSRAGTGSIADVAS